MPEPVETVIVAVAAELVSPAPSMATKVIVDSPSPKVTVALRALAPRFKAFDVAPLTVSKYRVTPVSRSPAGAHLTVTAWFVVADPLAGESSTGALGAEPSR